MEIDRRRLLALGSALALGTTPLGALQGQVLQYELEDDPLQRALATFWPLIQSLPAIRAPASEGNPSGDVCYMFTNRSCLVCQGVHHLYANGFRHLEMRYIVYPWPGEDRHILNYLYRSTTTAAEYEQYMAGKLTARADSDNPAIADQVQAAATNIANELIEGGGFGTPFFFYAAPADKPSGLAFTAGDINAVEALLNKGV
jgi:hypothetical protein